MYVGMDRFDVRKQICIDLEKAGLLEKVEDYTNKVGFSERTNVPIEPKLSMQWFLKMEHLAQNRFGTGDEGRNQVLSGQIQKYLPSLDGEHQGLVYQPPVVVGTPHPGLLPATRRIRGGRDC